MVAPGGKLIVDVSHPDRFIGLEWIGEPGRRQHDTRPRREYCFKIGDESLWEECRTYAQSLADAAGLSIEGPMIAQHPVNGVTNKLDAIEDWIKERRPRSWDGSLSRREKEWFRRDYVESVSPYYTGKGYSYQPEIAAVLVTFSKQPSTTADLVDAPTGLSRQERSRAENNAKKGKKGHGNNMPTTQCS